ncbi:MAG: HD domain-containing protein [Candidatus Latescibacteria bacterium]|jgi:hypothetical protein|nr:HD domain-containing protein [Candidatus Latescibacterota bacterium]
MKVPTTNRALAYLTEAQALNPGAWIDHSLKVGEAARAIADAHPKLDGNHAYVMGALHDIGRRAGRTEMRHVLDGYEFLIEEGYDDAARICLTHSFSLQDVNAVFGKWDCSEEELDFVRDYLSGIEYSDYDRLIQLCDALALPSGCCLMEKRMVDVALRYGVNDYTVPKWKAVLQIKVAFEGAVGCSIYELLPGVVENTFGTNKSPTRT